MPRACSRSSTAIAPASSSRASRSSRPTRPQAVNDAFKEVTAAQQEAQSYINQARAYALQLTPKAQGEAAAFDKVYEQYRLAPEVTRRRMYYETMERVLQKVDKTIIEAPGVTPYLPLPEVQRRSAAAGSRRNDRLHPPPPDRQAVIGFVAAAAC